MLKIQQRSKAARHASTVEGAGLIIKRNVQHIRKPAINAEARTILLKCVDSQEKSLIK